MKYQWKANTISNAEILYVFYIKTVYMKMILVKSLVLFVLHTWFSPHTELSAWLLYLNTEEYLWVIFINLTQ